MEGFFIPDVLVSGTLERPGPRFHVLFPETTSEKCCPEPPHRSEDIQVWFVPQASREEAQERGAHRASRVIFFSFIAFKSTGEKAQSSKCLLRVLVSFPAVVIK